MTIKCHGCGKDSEHKCPRAGTTLDKFIPPGYGVAWDQSNGLESRFFCPDCSGYIAVRAREIQEKLKIKYTYLAPLTKMDGKQ